jgi:hypothetical protein
LDQAGFFSYLTFSWVGPYMTKAYRYGLQPEDVPLCSTRDGCDHCAQRYIDLKLDLIVNSIVFFKFHLEFLIATGWNSCGTRKSCATAFKRLHLDELLGGLLEPEF